MEGYRVESASDGLMLTRKAAENRPDLIISDVQMPGAYGSAAHEALQREDRTKGIPVIFISAHPLDGLIPKDPKMRFLQKPIDLEKLKKYIAELLTSGGPLS
jgi:CheY-like chemotaxis protein